ncbi:MAG: aminomethyl-transferring glycine dehydrogenase subunit GcvPB, partial [Chloroflexi bacterium]|nr:aminomethyl-transferring glycine dehydrogenase subunit GcvPB [Chloroflexota bacterium]
MTTLLEQFELNRRQLLMERSSPGRIGTTLPPLDVPEAQLPDSDMLREDLEMPEVSEGDLVRYFSQISQFNFSIDHNFYPLGSCTMKYNPKLNDEIASLPGLTQIHPLQPESTVQGAIKLIWELQGYMAEMTGLSGVSLAPMAGADGELAGMLMTRAYHLERGDTQRKKVLIPDSAHGTNPASAAMAGFEVVTLPSDANGNTDLGALRASANDELAGLMITLPSTLGLFDTNILEVTRIVRDAGGIVYGDGANLNAIVGRVRLGDLGFDVIHSNLHKTFTQPHGGGGPGSGPVIAGERLVDYLPLPVVTRSGNGDDERFSLEKPPKSIGRMGAFHGNFGALVRAYAYICTLGKEGIPQISEDSVINANYIMSQLKGYYDLPYDRTCMHEVVFSARNLKRDYGVSALDVSKRLIDYGIHPPTMYFPLIVEEALMIEPTETESKETLDYFIEVMKTIANEAA